MAAPARRPTGGPPPDGMTVPETAVERAEGPTPAGGAWSVAHYLDAGGRPVAKADAVRLRIVEHADDGSVLAWTEGVLGGAGPDDDSGTATAPPDGPPGRVRLVVRPDWRCHCVWLEDEVGAEVAPEDLPVSEALRRRLSAWEERHDRHLDWSDPGNSPDPGEAEMTAFHAEGRAITAELRRQLAATHEVRYWLDGPGDPTAAIGEPLARLLTTEVTMVAVRVADGEFRALETAAADDPDGLVAALVALATATDGGPSPVAPDRDPQDRWGAVARPVAERIVALADTWSSNAGDRLVVALSRIDPAFAEAVVRADPTGGARRIDPDALAALLTGPDPGHALDTVDEAFDDADWMFLARTVAAGTRGGGTEPWLGELLARRRWARALGDPVSDDDLERAARTADAVVDTAQAWRGDGADPGPWLTALGEALDGCGAASCCPPSPFESALLERGHDLRTGRYLFGTHNGRPGPH